MHQVVEHFHSIQSEGYHAGRSAYFIRLYGCNLKCDFGNGMLCDEPLHTKPDEITSYTTANLADLAKGDFVVITGGEPSLNNINPLIKALQEKGIYVAVETNGYNYDNPNYYQM